MARLGADDELLSRTPSLSVSQLYEELKALGAVPMLLGIVGSWGDTLPDDEVLEALRDWKQSTEERVRHITCPNCNVEMVSLFGMDTILMAKRECPNCKKEFLIVNDVLMTTT
jgi:hypothetical protein